MCLNHYSKKMLLYSYKEGTNKFRQGTLTARLSKVASCRRKVQPTWLVRPATLLGISLQMTFFK